MEEQEQGQQLTDDEILTTGPGGKTHWAGDDDGDDSGDTDSDDDTEGGDIGDTDADDA